VQVIKAELSGGALPEEAAARLDAFTAAAPRLLEQVRLVSDMYDVCIIAMATGI
jgi:hypothetical protein